MLVALVILDLLLGILLLLVFRTDLEDLRRRMSALERRGDRPVPEPRAAAVQPSIAIAPPVAPVPPVVPAPPRAAASTAPRAFSTEEMVGSVWTQNVGAVLLLLGVFFLILWGYSTGRFGPGVLVVTGVAMGGLFFWRGHHVAKSLPMLGHAFVGIGLGIAYLALYLGHFALGVLAPLPAFGLMAAVSVAGILAGMHYRVQAIAGLATLGAFVPQVASILAHVPGFAQDPGTLLLYLLVVDGIVLALARRSGWSSLAFFALFATVLTWSTSLAGRTWGWPVQAGLTVLTLGFGLAALPRLARARTQPAAAELAVVTLAPYAFVICSWKFLVATPAPEVAILLAVLAILYGVLSLRLMDAGAHPLLHRATLTPAVGFLAAALERALGTTLTPMVWAVAGVALVAVGAGPGPGAGWLRGLGSVLTALGVLGTMGHLVLGRSANEPPLFSFLPFRVMTAATLRQLVVVAALFVGSRAQRRAAERTNEDVADLWHVAGTLALAAWIARLAADLGMVLVPPLSVPYVNGPLAYPRPALSWPPALVLVAAAWLVQAAILLLRSRPARPPRFAAHFVALLSLFALLCAVLVESLGSPWRHPGTPLGSPAVLFQAAFLAWTWMLVRMLTAAERSTARGERLVLQATTLAVQAIVLRWLVLEARHLSALWPAGDAVRMSAVLASTGWLAQALLMFGLGWARDVPFLRWLGLALFGATVLKVTISDLSTIDPFWRFLVAIATGIVLLGVSFLYQRSRRRAG